MRAAVLSEFGSPLVVEEVTLRDPGPREVVVRLQAAAMCITDVLSAQDGMTLAPLPLIPGHSAAGIVEAVGPGTTHVTVGDQVAIAGSVECGVCHACTHGSPGACDEVGAGMVPPREVAHRQDGTPLAADFGTAALAERMVYREIGLATVRSDVPPEHLAMLGCGVISGLGAVLNIADVQAGASVAIVGCGHLGLWMVQAANLAGASQIVAVESRAERRALAAELGATHVVDPADGDPVAQVRDLTPRGRGVDYALEAGGSTLAMEQSFAMARAGGTVVPTSMESVTATVTLPGIDYAIGAKRILSSQTGGSFLRRDLPRFADLLASGAIRAEPIHTHTYALDEVNEAISAARDRTGITGVIRFD